MKYGILGDIHSNLSALETVLEALHGQGVDRILSVGDVVGYGAAPTACIDLLRDHEVVTVKGNHDAACVGEVDLRFFNPYARESALWTRGQLATPELNWLRALPMTVELEHCQAAHGTLHEPEEYHYLIETADADPSLEIMTRPLCFVGHSHVPIAFLRLREHPDRTAYTRDPDIDVSGAERTLVNVGSVGQPRDREPRTAYALYDTEECSVRIRRLEYDVDREAQRILSAGLPQILADRLRHGL